MNRKEQSLLGETIKAIARRHRNSWNRLKYEIFEYGNQSFYPSQADFHKAAAQAIERLDDDLRLALIHAWKTAAPRRAVLSDQEILSAYQALIVETIVQRAEAAAYRSSNLEI